MPSANWLIAYLCGIVLVACTNQSAVAPHVQSESENFRGSADKMQALAANSCPNSVTFIDAPPISIRAEAVPIPPEQKGAALNGVNIAGLWHLTSNEPNFGGLSGLAILRSGSLLAVSDAGAFVWIGMENGVPSEEGAIAYMRDENGKVIEEKSAADAEGLDLTESGLALVSFERDHRVLAFDLEGCGSAARGVPFADIPNRPSGLNRSIPSNSGMEALMINTEGEVIGGLEMSVGRSAVVGSLSPANVRFDQRLERPSGTRLVGLDTLDNRFFALFRGYSPLTGNRIIVHSYKADAKQAQQIVKLEIPFPVDNFEGIAATSLDAGKTRLYLIADDNFSGSQRTLLLALDVPADTGQR